MIQNNINLLYKNNIINEEREKLVSVISGSWKHTKLVTVGYQDMDICGVSKQDCIRVRKRSKRAAPSSCCTTNSI